ncbi:unnamed protein product [Cyclocybe aegerita]|uniref:Uncharacterized protein n=1 Tax=Cyclocybe aegerita TaxID=1973307 RepID=A0A8S0WJQ0_CYCAE|nr:unnamed protein product [Cyclocybe aegerita]
MDQHHLSTAHPIVQAGNCMGDLQPEHQLWKTLWHSQQGDGVPLFSQHAVARDMTLTDQDTDIHNDCWLLQIPEHILGGTCTSPILFREEYFEALQSLFRAVGWDHTHIGVDDADSPGPEFRNPLLRRREVAQEGRRSCFILEGGPGIGSSSMAMFRIVPSITWEVRQNAMWAPDRIVFFDQDGPVYYRTVDDVLNSAAAVQLWHSRELWVLVDVKNDHQHPVDRLYHSRGVFVIQATTTNIRYTRWRDKLSYPGVSFLLRPWSLAELIIGRKLHEHAPSERSIHDFVQKFGTAPQAVYKYADAQKEYEAEVLTSLSSPPYLTSTSFDEIATDLPALIVLRPTNRHPVAGYAAHLVSAHAAGLLMRAKVPAAAKQALARALYYEFLGVPFLRPPHALESALWIREANARRSLCEGRVWGLYPADMAPNGCSKALEERPYGVPPTKHLFVHPGAARVSIEDGLVPPDLRPFYYIGPTIADPETVLADVDLDYVLLYDRRTHHAIVLEPLKPISPMPAFEEETRRRLQALRSDGAREITYVRVRTSRYEGVSLAVGDLVDEAYDMYPPPEDPIGGRGMFI